MTIDQRGMARAAFWVSWIGFVAVGVRCALSVGAGFLLGAVLVAAYARARGSCVPTGGYVLLAIAMPAIAGFVFLTIWSSNA